SSQTALLYENQSLTYDELNRKSNQLARYLLRLNIQPNDVVGICMEPSFNLMITIWGILKAGAAYLPVDPSYPTERLKFILQDANVKALITKNNALHI